MKAQVRYHQPGWDPTINTRPPRSLLPYFLRQMVLLGIFLVVLACGGTFMFAYKAGQDTARNALITLTVAVDQTTTATLATVGPTVTPSETPTGTLLPSKTPTITLTPSETPTGTLTPTTTPNVASIQASATMLANQVMTLRPTATATASATAAATAQPRSGAQRPAQHIEIVYERVEVTSRPVVIVRTQMVIQEVTRVVTLPVSQTPQPTQVVHVSPTQTLQASPTATNTLVADTATAVLVQTTAAPTATAIPMLMPTETLAAPPTETLIPTEIPTDAQEIVPPTDPDQAT